MKIDILVNHYKEEESVVRRFLSSLEMQKDVDFEVTIVSDGGNINLMEMLKEQKNISIKYSYLQHSGVCHTRNVLMDWTTADYIMFCDIDDMFSRPDGLYSLAKAAEETEADIVGSPYQCEYLRNGEYKYYTEEKDTVRVHGKIFKRSFLVNNNIRFPDELEMSGDMSFTWLAFMLSEKTIWSNNNFYIWKHNPNSVTRSIKFNDIRIYDKTIKCFTLLAEDLKKRNRLDLFKNLVTTTISTLYVDSTHPYWKAAPEEFRKLANETVHNYLKTYYSFYKNVEESFRRSQYELMSNTKKIGGLSGKFEDIPEWAELYLSDRYNGSNVLIVGLGVVGSNLKEELSPLYPDVYDKYKMIDTRKAGKYKLAFICVDTPSTRKSFCDISEVQNAILENDAEIYVIKSTVLPGTTEELIRSPYIPAHKKSIIFSPEYYGGTQHCNNYDFNFTILGGRRQVCVEVVQILQNVYDARHQFRITWAKTAELVKYMENSYLATKVSFCNQFFNIAEKCGVDYEELRELFVLDPRVEPSHTFVYRDRPYWDSHCLNKDVLAIARQYNATLLLDVVTFNEHQKDSGEV